VPGSVILLFVVFAAALYCSLYVWSRFTYAFDETALNIRWRLPGGILFGARRVSYELMAEFRPVSWRRDASGFGELWGNFPARQPYVLILRPSFFRRGPFRKLWLTPQDPAAFASHLASQGVRAAHAAQQGDEAVGP
jgi:hypothetical protein